MNLDSGRRLIHELWVLKSNADSAHRAATALMDDPLIQAAPMLHAVCRDLLTVLELNGWWAVTPENAQRIQERLKEAIALAEGKRYGSV